jgi:hypothetical protein
LSIFPVFFASANYAPVEGEFSNFTLGWGKKLIRCLHVS